MHSRRCLAISLLLPLCACIQDPPTRTVNASAAVDGGFDISGAAAAAPSQIPNPISSGTTDVDETTAGGAECVTDDGAPYVAPKC